MVFEEKFVYWIGNSPKERCSLTYLPCDLEFYQAANSILLDMGFPVHGHNLIVRRDVDFNFCSMMFEKHNLHLKQGEEVGLIYQVITCSDSLKDCLVTNYKNSPLVTQHLDQDQIGYSNHPSFLVPTRETVTAVGDFLLSNGLESSSH